MNKPFIKIKSKRKHKSINSSIPFVSITHRKNNIFIAISDKPIGIDCEYIKKYSNAWKKKMFSEEEVLISEDFFNKRDIFDKETIYIIMWCLKESTNKLCGYYLIGDLPKIRIEVKNECLTTYISKKKDMYNNYISILDDLILVVTM